VATSILLNSNVLMLLVEATLSDSDVVLTLVFSWVGLMSSTSANPVLKLLMAGTLSDSVEVLTLVFSGAMDTLETAALASVFTDATEGASVGLLVG